MLGAAGSRLDVTAWELVTPKDCGVPSNWSGRHWGVLELGTNLHPAPLRLQGIFFSRSEASVGRRWAWMRSRLAEGLWLSILSRSRQTASGDAAVSQDVASRSDPLRSTRGCSLHMRFEFGAWSRAAPGAGPAAWETSPRLFQLTQFTAITVSRT